MPHTTPTFSLIIPVFNEVESLRPLLERITATPAIDRIEEILVVDDGSTDGTAASVVGMRKVRVLQHECNKGIGHAMRTALDQISTSHFIRLDGDGQHPEAALSEFIAKLEASEYVEGVRTRMHLSLMRRVGNQVLTGLANLLIGRAEPDLLSGYYGARCGLVRPMMTAIPRGAGFCAFIKLSMLMQASSMARVDYICLERTPGTSSKLQPWQDGLRVVRMLVIMSWRHARWRLVLFLAILAAAVVVSGLLVCRFLS